MLDRQIDAAADAAGVPRPLFRRLVAAESNHDPAAVSSAGALGLTQLMPATARDPGYGLKPADPHDPADNLRLGAEYLRAMYREFGDWRLALNAYNWGPGNVRAWRAAGGDPARLPAETRAHEERVLGPRQAEPPAVPGGGEPRLPAAGALDLAHALEAYQAPLWAQLRAHAALAWDRSALGRWTTLAPVPDSLEEFKFRAHAGVRGAENVPERYRAPALSAEAWRGSRWYRDGLAWDPAMTETRARSMAEAWDEREYNRWLIERSPDSFWRGLMGFGAEIAAGLVDPVNWVPVFGPATRAALIARAGPVAGRAVAHGGEAAIATAAVTPFVVATGSPLGDDMSLAEAALDIAVSAAAGAVLGGAHGLYRRWRGEGRPERIPVTARATMAANALLDEAVAATARGAPVRLSPGALAAAQPAIRREVEALSRAYDRVRAQPIGPADDPLVRIRPEDIEATIIARGGWKGLGDIEVKGAGWGLVKFIWRHGEASAKPAAKQVSRDDILAFPQVIRNYEARQVGQQREWVVARADGERVVYVDSPVAGKEGRRVITIHVLGDDKRLPLSRRRDAGAPASPGKDGSLGGDTAHGPYTRRPHEGQDAPAPSSIGAAAPGAIPRTAPLVRLDPAEVLVDAARFQFKAGGDAAGVTDRLAGVVDWDERLAGLAMVWEDHAGRRFIADGHQRLALAQRAKAGGQPDVWLNALLLRESDGVSAAEARALAAFKNLAEGTGTAVDAAKVFRAAAETGFPLPPLPPRSTLIRDGRALARLSPEAFGVVVNEVVPAGHAAIVGRLIADPELQLAALKVLAAAKPDTLMQAEIIVRDVLETGALRTRQRTLFGTETTAESVVLERAKVLDEALKRARKDRAAFAVVVKEAGRIEGAGNVLSSAANRERLSQDEQLIAAIVKLATRRGAISDALTDAARQFKRGALSRAKAADGFLAAVRERLAKGLDAGDDTGGAGRSAEGAERVEAPEPDPAQTRLFDPSEAPAARDAAPRLTAPAEPDPAPPPPLDPRPASAADTAAALGLDLDGGHDLDGALAQLREAGRLAPEAEAELAAADALVARADSYARAYEAAAACLTGIGG